MAKKVWIEVGKLGKTFGFNGSLKLDVDDRQLPVLQAAEFVFIETSGNKIPYFVSEIMDGNPLTIKLEDIDSKETAQTLSGQKIYLESLVTSSPKEKKLKEIGHLSELIGFNLQDELTGPIGEILDIYELPQQWLAAIVYQEKEILIPLNDQFITAIDETQQLIYTKLPEGLLDL